MINLFFITTLIIITVTAYGKSIMDTTATMQLYPQSVKSPLYIHGSSYYSVGTYSTSTISKSLNTYLTVEQPKKWFSTLSYQELTFSRDDMGDNYFNQYILLGKAGLWLNNRINLSGFFAYNFQSGMAYYFNGFKYNSQDFIFTVYGGNANYWFNRSTAVGFSYSGGIRKTSDWSFTNPYTLNETSERAFDNYSLHFYCNVYKSIWSQTTGTVTYAKWAGQYFMFRENISTNLTDYLRVNVSVGIGRRAFYFDDELLVMYNPPDVQKACYVVGASIGITKNIFVFPSFEYDAFDDYLIRYGTIGFRITL